MAHIKNHWQEGDVVYLYHFASYPFRYYAERYGFEEKDYISGLPVEDNPERYTRHLYKLQDKDRVWALFTHYYFRRGIDPLELYQGEMDRMGKRVSTFAREGAVVYLYQMGRDEP
jgi:hypothetical protein